MYNYFSSHDSLSDKNLNKQLKYEKKFLTKK